MSDSEMSPASKTSDVHRLVSSQDRAFIEHVAQWRDDSPEKQRIRELENACKQALEAMQWDVGGEPIYTLEIAAIAELKRVLDC